MSRLLRGGTALLASVLATACARHPAAPATAPPPAAAPNSAEPTQRALESDSSSDGALVSEAMAALGKGRLHEAASHLEQVMGSGPEAEGRVTAHYLLALLLARPDYAERDITRARAMLEGLLESHPPAAHETGARLVLSLLELEEDYVRLIADLRIRAAASGAEADDLRGVLAQREAELRRIKDILLGRAGGS